MKQNRKKMEHHVAEQIHTLPKTILHLFCAVSIYSPLILKHNEFIEVLLHPPQGKQHKKHSPSTNTQQKEAKT